jgi:hypothetical protein
MRPQAPALVFSLIVLLAVGAGLVVGLDGREQPRRQAQEFQQLVGGFGFGPATDLTSCPFAFDPRLGPDCAHRYGPIPGGETLCPHHACSVFDYPPLRQEATAR